MSKLFKENGFLTEEGQRSFAPVEGEIRNLLSSKEVRDMSEAELRLLGSNLASLVGNMISNHIQSKRDLTNKFAKMTDEQFYAFLKVKYGERWMLVSLAAEEFERLPRLSQEDIKKSIEEGIKARNEALDATPVPYINPGLRFR